MWAILGWFLLIVGVYLMDRRYRHLRQQIPGGFKQTLAVGNRMQPLWKVWGGVSCAVITGCVSGRMLGLEGMYSAWVVAVFTLLYFERRRYPRILLTTGPHGTRVAFEDLRSTTIDISEKSQCIFDGGHLELRDEESRKRIVLSRHDFPKVDFHSLWECVMEGQRDHTAPARGNVSTIGGFRAVEGVSDLFFPREAYTGRLLLLCFWIGFLMLAMKRILE